MSRTITTSLVLVASLLASPTGASAREAPKLLACDNLVDTGRASICLTSGESGYRLSKSVDGIHWQTWTLVLAGFSGEARIQSFGRFGNGWYLQDVSNGLYLSSDLRSWSRADPLATGTAAQVPNVVRGRVDHGEALIIANSGGLPATLAQPGLPVPRLGMTGQTAAMIWLGRSTMAIGHSLTLRDGPLQTARCSSQLVCNQQPTTLAGSRLVAAAPISKPRFLLVQDRTGRATMYRTTSTGLTRSRALTRILSSLQPGAVVTNFQLGALRLSRGNWALRLVFDPDITSKSPSRPADLILRGSPETDRWQIAVQAASQYRVSSQIGTAGVSAPWHSAVCNQPEGAAISRAGPNLLIEHCIGNSGMLYESPDWIHWAPISHG
jgi:hypothetical protein